MITDAVHVHVFQNIRVIKSFCVGSPCKILHLMFFFVSCSLLSLLLSNILSWIDFYLCFKTKLFFQRQHSSESNLETFILSILWFHVQLQHSPSWNFVSMNAFSQVDRFSGDPKSNSMCLMPSLQENRCCKSK